MQDYREKSFWLESAGDYTERAALDGDARADICIIGAGFTGLSTAIHLKEKDPSLNVVIVESGIAGYGASGRNGGFSMRLFGITMEITALRYNKQKVKEADDYMMQAVDYLENMIQRYDIDCEYQREGMITVATNPFQLKHLEKEMKLATDAGLTKLSWLDAEQTRALVNSPTYLGARYDEQCAILHPAKLAWGLAQKAGELGVKIYERTKVTDVKLDQSVVITDRGSIRADKIVFATNAYSSFHKKLNAKQMPIYTYIVATEPLNEQQLSEIGWQKRVGIEDGRNLLHYYRMTKDNRLIFGGSNALYYYGNPLDRDQSEITFETLKQTVLKTFPQLKGIKFTHQWGGPISATLDLVPVIGNLRPNILYSMGCMGHGVSMTNYNGLTMAEILLGEKSERTEFFMINRRMTPLPPEPFRYLTAEGILKYLRYEDRKGERMISKG